MIASIYLAIYLLGTVVELFIGKTRSGGQQKVSFRGAQTPKCEVDIL